MILDIPQVSGPGLDAVSSLPRPYRSADAAAGRQAFALCIGCHNFSIAGVPGKGPSLQGVYGAHAATRPDFTYSDALRGSGIVWDAPHLDRWIFNPHEALPGTSMGFIGVRNDRKRRDLVAYLVAVSPPATSPPPG